MWVVLLLIIIVGLAIALLPQLKGYRTLLLGHLTWFIGAAVPVVTEVLQYLQGLDWREYILSGDKKNLLVLAVVGGLGVLMVIMRHLTKGAVGEK